MNDYGDLRVWCCPWCSTNNLSDLVIESWGECIECEEKSEWADLKEDNLLSEEVQFPKKEQP